MMIPSFLKTAGFTLVETILAVAIFSIIGSAFTVIFLQGWRLQRRATQHDIAVNFAETGVEGVRSIQTSQWESIVPGTYGLVWSEANGWGFSANPTVEDGFTRRVVIELISRDGSQNISSTGEVDEETYRATVVVSWNNVSNTTQEVSLETLLTRWKTSTGSITGGTPPTPAPAPISCLEVCQASGLTGSCSNSNQCTGTEFTGGNQFCNGNQVCCCQ